MVVVVVVVVVVDVESKWSRYLQFEDVGRAEVGDDLLGVGRRNHFVAGRRWNTQKENGQRLERQGLMASTPRTVTFLKSRHFIDFSVLFLFNDSIVMEQ